MTVENNAFKLLMVSFLLFIALSFSRFAFAQEAVIAPTRGETPENGGTIVDEPGNETTPVIADQSMSPYWLLPLIAIPILLFIVWPRRRHDSMDLSSGYAGVKGGRSEKIEEDLEDDDLF